MKDTDEMALDYAETSKHHVKGPAVLIDFDEEHAEVKFMGLAQAPPTAQAGVAANSTAHAQTDKVRAGAIKPKELEDAACECKSTIAKKGMTDEQLKKLKEKQSKVTKEAVAATTKATEERKKAETAI